MMSTFGGGSHDLYISNDCNINNISCSYLGNIYEAPNGHACGSIEAKNYLAGSYNFTVAEIEVFKLI